MLVFGLLIGGILFVGGLGIYFLAPIIGPNPIFGMRIGYAYANRETWDKTNRFGGGLFAIIGVGIVLLDWLVQFLNPAVSDERIVLVPLVLVAVIGAVIWTSLYARNLSQGTPVTRELVAIRFHWAYLAPTLATFALLIALMLYLYPMLPADRIASHFNINDQADGWQTRDQFVLMFLGMAAWFAALNVLIVWIATREPLIAFQRWGAWRLDPERGLYFVGLVFALVNLIFIALLWNIWWFTMRGALAFSFWLILWMTIPLIGFIIALFFLLGKRET